MKKILIIVTLACVTAIAARAGETEVKPEPKEKKSAPSAEQKAARKELVEKYDANKNGRLDKEERSKMTPEDQEKWKNLAGSKKKEKEAH